MKVREYMLIRKANKEDVKNIIEYFNIVGGESNNLLFGKDEFKNMSIESQEKIIENINNSKNNVMLVAILNSEIVSIGFLQGFTKERIKHRANLAISVSKNYWGQKIGEKMIFAKQYNIKIIELQVKNDNIRAIKLYKK